MKLTAKQIDYLNKSYALLSNVQIELMKADERLPGEQRNNEWRKLFTIRCELNRVIDHLRKLE